MFLSAKNAHTIHKHEHWAGYNFFGVNFCAVKIAKSCLKIFSTFVYDNFHFQTPNTYKVTPFSTIGNFMLFKYCFKVLSHNFIKSQKRAKTCSTQPTQPTAIPTEVWGSLLQFLLNAFCLLLDIDEKDLWIHKK